MKLQISKSRDTEGRYILHAQMHLDEPELKALKHGDNRHTIAFRLEPSRIVAAYYWLQRPTGLVRRVWGRVTEGYIVDWDTLRNGFAFAFNSEADVSQCEKIINLYLPALSTTRALFQEIASRPPPPPPPPPPPAPKPFEVLFEDRGEHTAIIAGAGHGKTQLLLSIIASDLRRPNPPGIVVIDPTGGITARVQRLALFNGALRDRIIILDPEMEPAPALNMFDLPTARLANYTVRQRQALENDIVDLFKYVFASADISLTALQEGPFAYLVRLMLTMPGSTLYTLRDLLEDRVPRNGGYDDAKFKPQIEALAGEERNRALVDFFRTRFYTSSMDAARESILNRVYVILHNAVIEEMFCAKANKVDFFHELNRGAIILVNTNENILRNESTLFGRYIIARCMAAAFERQSIPEQQRRQAFLFVDEAGAYFDDEGTFEKLLNRVRQFKLGACVAFQELEQASIKLRSAIAASTAIKYAGGTGASDARWLADNMRCNYEFILDQQRDSSKPPQWTNFACYVRNSTPTAVSLHVPFYTLEKLPQMTSAEHTAMLTRNRARVAAASPSPPPPAPEPEPEPRSVSMDDLGLADAYAQLALAIRRGNTKRVEELQDYIASFLKRQADSEQESTTRSRMNPKDPYG